MQDLGRASDEELADLVRSGHDDAFGVLWHRHARAGLTAARQFRNLADPEDLVSDAYLQILRALQRGGGPHEAFRPYLYRTIRNTALNRRRDDGTVPIDAVAELEHPDPGPEDAAVRNTITVRAFRTLPERWQTVLWYTEVEGMEPAEVAPVLGLTANGVAALAYRAREGLKKAWLQAHVNDLRVPAGCRWTTERMGDYVRDTLSPASRLRFDQHLESCTRCSILVEEIDDLGHRLAVVLFPVVLGGAAAAGLLAERSIDGWRDHGDGGSTASSGTNSTASSGTSSTASGAAAVGTATAVAASAMSAATAASASALRPLRLVIGGVGVAIVAAASVALAASGVFAPTPPTDPLADPPAASPSPSSEPTDERPDPAPTTPPIVPSPAPELPPGAPPVTRPAPPVVVPTPTPTPTPTPPADTVPPAAPAVASGIDGSLGNDPLPVFSGEGEPAARVELERVAGPGGTGVLTSALVGADGTWSVTPTNAFPDGEHRLRVTQVDAAGNRSAPVEVTITVDTVALPPVVTALPGEHRVLPDVTGTAEPGATVELRGAEGESLGTVVAGADGGWLLPLPDPAAGTQTVSAIQTDLAGNTSAPSESGDPIVLLRPHFTAPADGASFPSDGEAGASVEVRFDGEPGRQVEVLIDGVPTGNIHTLEDAPLIRVTPTLAPGEHTIAIRYVELDPRRVGATTVLRFTID